MQILVIGAGKIGSVIIEHLAAEGHNVTFIDTDPAVTEALVNRCDVMGITGNGADRLVQLDAGVKNADLVIAATPSDELNMLCGMIAKKLGAAHTAARIRDPAHAQQISFLHDALGFDMIINPEQQTAAEISRMLNFPSAIRIDSFAKGRVDIAEVKLPDDCPYVGLTLMELRRSRHANILVCAVRRGDDVFIPAGDFTLCAGDRIHITAPHPELIEFLKSIGVYRQRLRNVFLLGGGRIGYYLARRLQELGMHVTLVERDRETCISLTEALPHARIVCGDGTDQDLLREEGIAKADACISITDIDEENIVISMFARKIGVEKIVTKINKRSLTDMMSGLGLDSVVSPKTVTANTVLRYVRGMQNSRTSDRGGSDILTLYKLAGEQVEALEFLVGEEEAIVRIPLRELRLKQDLLIACVIREGQVIFPGGADTLLPGDRVIIVARSSCIGSLADILR